MIKRSPAFQFYPSDWLSSMRVTLMTIEEEGIYIRLLCYCWSHGFIPNSVDLSYQLLGKKCSKKSVKKVLEMFEVHPENSENRYSARLDVERGKQENWRKKSSLGGKKSRERRSNGSTTLATVVQQPFQPNGNSSSSSSSNINITYPVASILADEIWVAATVKSLSLKSPDQIPKLMDLFQASLIVTQTIHTNDRDFKSHFVNWCRKQPDVIKQTDGSRNINPNIYQDQN